MNIPESEMFQHIFYEHYPIVKRKLVALIRDEAAADDLAQDVFLRLYRNPPDDPAALGAWLHRVLTRIGYDYMTKKARERRLQDRQEILFGNEESPPTGEDVMLRKLDHAEMEKQARAKLSELGLMTIQNINQAVETLSGGQRQGVAVARAAAFGSKVIILDEPTAALGVKESRRVLELILDVRSRGIPIVLISHNMPHVFEVADRIHIHRLGKRLTVINPKDYSMSDAVAFMTGAKAPPTEQIAA